MTGERPPARPLAIHPACLDADVLAAECDFHATRRSGPGGQNRNKVETAVVLTHRPTGITGLASERRTQGENRRVGLFRLRLNLALELRLPVAFGEPACSQPSALWQRRCKTGRIVVSPEHDDFPSLLAEALDVLASTGWDPKRSAGSLGCSPSQLIKLLKCEPRALAILNHHRRQAGLHEFL
ncbi:MAG: peptide chain release factor-like protein [Isosphaeraceae bacterium]